MTAIVACSITVLAMIGQELEARKGQFEMEAVGVQALSGALELPVESPRDLSWQESVEHVLTHALSQ